MFGGVGPKRIKTEGGTRGEIKVQEACPRVIENGQGACRSRLLLIEEGKIVGGVFH